MQKIAVLFVSTDAILRQHWLGLSHERFAIDQAQTLEQAQEWAQHRSSGVVVIDAALVDLTNKACLRLLSQSEVQVVVASLSPSDVEGQQMIVAGAKGYFHAYSSMAILESMLKQVSTGHIWIGQSLLSRLLSQVSTQLTATSTPTSNPAWQQGLTPREIEVAQRAALGHSNSLIAQDLGITERTVRAHLGAVFEKLDVADRLMLALKVHGIG